MQIVHILILRCGRRAVGVGHRRLQDVAQVDQLSSFLVLSVPQL